MDEFKPRKFVALVDEFGYDDGGVASFVFRVQSLTKGKIYFEEDPFYLEGNQKGVVIDDNACWHHYGTKSFNQKFKEVE